jgi:long-chain acyl-CoA synthetase
MTGGRLTQGLRRAAQVKPAGVAVIDGAHRYSWKEVASRVARAAGVLRDAGLSDGGRVAILAHNSHRYFEIYYAIPWAGGAIVPLNTRLALPEMQYILRTGARSSSSTRTRGCCAAIRGGAGVAHAAYGDTPAPRLCDYEARSHKTEPPPMRSATAATRGIFYTGGSTGKAKGVMLSHDNLVCNAVNGCYMIGYDPSSVYLHAAPMCYLTDGMSAPSITMAAGTHVLFRALGRDSLDAMAEHRVTNIALVPTMIRDREFSRYRTARLSHLRHHVRLLPITEGTLKRAVEFGRT